MYIIVLDMKKKELEKLIEREAKCLSIVWGFIMTSLHDF